MSDAGLSGRTLSLVRRRVCALEPRSWRVPDRAFFLPDARMVARRLLGSLLLRIDVHPSGDLAIRGGRIVETEAYLGETDLASHASHGRTARTEILYQPGGVAYVYLAYGAYYCLNVVTGPAGQPFCVLIRALEPMLGVEVMAKRRGVQANALKRLCSGPGKLCQALGITTRQTGWDLTASPLLVMLSDKPAGPVSRGRRIGVTRAAGRPLRFCLSGSPWLSRRERG